MDGDHGRTSDDEPFDEHGAAGDSDEKTIVDGLFGIANDENTSDSSICNDDIEMEVEDNTIIDHGEILNSNNSNELEMPTLLAGISKNQEQSSEENVPMDLVSSVDNQTNCNKLSKADLKQTFNGKNEKNDDCSTTDSNCFGSHLLSINSEVHDKSEIPSSFALISEIYQKSRKDDVSTETVLSKNKTICDVSESNTESVVVLPKGGLPSTLSLISANYQDSSSDDDSEDSSVVSINDIAFDSDDEVSIVSISKEQPIKTRGELDISDLPPIEDLKISVDEAKCQPVGCIKNIVETLVVVEAFLNQPPLDIDSVLFVDRGQRALGRIFDVFGPVNKPYYAVRFNNSEHIKKFDIHIKEPVYCAPQTEYASFVQISQLLEMKGSDASWRHNNEPPCDHLDYSDDEAEKLAKKKRKQKKCVKSEDNNTENKEKSPDPPAQNVAKRNYKHTVNNTPNSFAQNSNRPPNPYSPRPQNPNTSSYRPPNPNISSNRPPNPNTSSIRPPNPNNFSLRPPNLNNFSHPPPNPNTYSSCPPNHNYGPRQFPTYAQHLSSMDYRNAYRPPYNPFYNDQNMYPPRHSYPYQHPYRPPGYDYQSPPPNPNNPNQHQYPEY